MSAKAISLEHVLARKGQAQIDLAGMNVADLKQVARFWFGTTAANKLRKADGPAALKQVFQDRKRLADALRSLPEKERQVLAVGMRYGGYISGPLLLTELQARGLVEKPKERNFLSGYQPRTEDSVTALRKKLLLVSPFGGHYSRYDSYSYSYRLSYPDLEVLPAIRDLIEPAAVQPWAPSAPASEPTAASKRVAAEVVLDLWSTAQALAQAGTWKTNRGGSLSKSIQKRLTKLFAWPENDPLLPPNPEALGYEILRGLGAIEVEGDQGSIDLKLVERHLRGPAAVQAWHWARAWIECKLWQDGIGVVPDRDSTESARIEPRKLRTARELLVWALGRVAHGANEWLDLEIFLADLWSLAGEEMDLYWGRFSWNSEFHQVRGMDDLPAEPARRRTFWLARGGMWAANALLGTLAYLGLVEHGQVGSGRKTRYSFRLTGLGKAVFGAPDLALPPAAHDPKFLTVQPNHEVILYLDVADAGTVWPLAQMAQRTSSGGGLVQTFALTRESVYQALESGLTVAEIRQFLLDHSKTGLPANVGQSLTEWGQRRETLVLRTDVLLAAFPPGDSSAPERFPRGRALGEQFLLLPRTAARRHKDDLLLDHRNPARPVFRIDEDGRVSVRPEADAVALARLGQFAEPEGKGWKITAGSVRRARERGIPAEQILGWLQDHLANPLPAIVETCIRNWSGSSLVALGDLLVLQVPQAQACAMILASPRFQPLLLGHIPPNWFIIHPEKRQQLEQLLAELGFLARGAYRFAGPAEEDIANDEPPRKTRKGRRGRSG